MKEFNSKGAVSMGQSVYVEWGQIDVALNQWAKQYFGPHAEAEGTRDKGDFEIKLKCQKPTDYDKYIALFDRYDPDKEYEPDGEVSDDIYYVSLCGSVARGVTKEALPEISFSAIGTALAVYDGVFFMEHTVLGKSLSVKEQDNATDFSNPSVNEIRVNTEVGVITVTRKLDQEYAGVYIDLKGPGLNDKFEKDTVFLAAIEFDPYKNKVQAVVYGDGEEEDFTHLVEYENLLDRERSKDSLDEKIHKAEAQADGNAVASDKEKESEMQRG